MSARDIHGVGALCIFLVAAQAAPFAVGCQATARRPLCARTPFLKLHVAKMMSWPRLVRGALRSCVREERRGHEVARRKQMGRMRFT